MTSDRQPIRAVRERDYRRAIEVTTGFLLPLATAEWVDQVKSLGHPECIVTAEHPRLPDALLFDPPETLPTVLRHPSAVTMYVMERPGGLEVLIFTHDYA